VFSFFFFYFYFVFSRGTDGERERLFFRERGSKTEGRRRE